MLFRSDGKYDRFGLGDAQPHADVTVQSPRAKRSLPAHTSHDAPSAGSICDMVLSVCEAGAEVAEDDMAAAGSEVSAAVVDKVSKEDNSVADIFGHGDACEFSGDVVAGLNLN